MNRFAKTGIVLVIFLFLLCLFPQRTFAVFSFNIASVSATIITSLDQEITVNLNITSLPSESYFRVALQKESGGSYLGYIKNNNGDWSAIQSLSGDCTIYNKITDLSTTSLDLKFKSGEDATIDNGNFRLKAHRFTKTCTSYTEAINYYSMVLSVPTPIPSPTLIPTLTSIPTQTPSSTPSPSPTKFPTSTPIPSKVITPSITIEPTALEMEDENILDTLGEATISGEIEVNTSIPEKTKILSTKASKWPQVFMIAGGLILIACGILVYRNYFKKL